MLQPIPRLGSEAPELYRKDERETFPAENEFCAAHEWQNDQCLDEPSEHSQLYKKHNSLSLRAKTTD